MILPLTSYEDQLRRAESVVLRESTLNTSLRNDILESRNRSDSKMAELKATQTARALLSKLAENQQEEVSEKVNEILSYALKSIFNNDDYEIAVKQGTQRRTPVVRLSVSDADFETDSIINSRGGGITAIASFILSIILQTRANRNGSRTFVIDERFNFVPRAALPEVALLLSDLSKKGGCQFILVTHQPELIESGDIVYELVRKNGTTTARLL